MKTNYLTETKLMNEKPFTTETQRHRDSQRKAKRFLVFSLLLFLCVSVSLWSRVFVQRFSPSHLWERRGRGIGRFLREIKRAVYVYCWRFPSPAPSGHPLPHAGEGNSLSLHLRSFIESIRANQSGRSRIASRLLTSVSCFLMAACTTIGAVKPAGEAVSQRGVALPPSTQSLAASQETLIGAGGAAVVGAFLSPLPTALKMSASRAGAAAGALLYILYDPLAPNWTIEEQAVDAENYRVFLRAKNFRTGGDGEAIRIVHRRAQQLQREKGYTGYRLLDYSESIESATPFAYRTSEGTIQLVKTP